MSKINASAPLGEITFYEFFEPAWKSGNYNVTLTQTVTSTDTDNPINETYDASVAFAVLGPRFSVPAQYVHTQFPPPDAQGEYSNVLPHIVFKRKTLPWQRLIQADSSSDVSTIPWLALLTFDINDPPPEVVSGTLADLLHPPAGTASYPNFRLEMGESPDEPCLYVDIPAGLFYEIVPTMNDLPWLAHARSIDPGALLQRADERSADKWSPTEFSTVVSNRLPTPGNGTVCYLVSLENMGALLPTDGRAVPSSAPGTIRLAVLLQWGFGAVELPQTFSEYFNGLNFHYSAPITPQIPYINATGTTNTVVQTALAMGYTALNHYTRQGAATLSWYRGPFLPFANAVHVTLPASSADALVQYDPTTGMFDESLAAAWQLGQLMALNDKNFASMLYRWKRGQTEQAINEFETKFLAGELAVDPALISGEERPVLAQIIDKVVKPKLEAFVQTKRGSQQ